MSTIQKIFYTLRILRRRYPDGGALEIGTPYHVLVLVMLSARTRDEQVLKVAPELFAAFPTVDDLARASLRDIRSRISSIGLFRDKAKNLQAMARTLMRNFAGNVPRTIEELTTLPGVGRKTASVVLVAVFNVPAIAVDVHVARIAKRLGWTKATTPEHIEQQLRKIVPFSSWGTINQTFVPFGREICTAGTPRCWACPLVDVCRFSDKQLLAPSNAEEIMDHAQRQKAELARLKAFAKQAVARLV